MERRELLDITGKLAHLGLDSVNGVAVEVFKALGNDSRWRILSYLSERFVSVTQIAEDLRLPASTASRHIALLEEVGLVHTGMRPVSRGLEKVVARRSRPSSLICPVGTDMMIRSSRSACPSVHTWTSRSSRRAASQVPRR